MRLSIENRDFCNDIAAGHMTVAEAQRLCQLIQQVIHNIELQNGRTKRA